MSGVAKRVLIIAYIFPPTGGAGVQRVTKFVKYLPGHGWLPSVLTVENPSVPLFDGSLESDIPKRTIIRRAKTWEPGYETKLAVASDDVASESRSSSARRILKAILKRAGKLVLQPDPQILWVPQAIQEGRRLLRQIPHQVILATAPPFSTFLVGSALSRQCGIPLVLDYRDEWDLANTYFENRRPDLWSRLVQRKMQYGAVRSASALIATTRASARSLKCICTAARSAAEVTTIYNGYDADDFAEPSMNGVAKSDRYRLVYVGTIFRLASPAPLVEAVRLVAQRDPKLCTDLEVVFAGRRIGSEARALETLKTLPCHVEEHAYVPHGEVVRILYSADALLVLITDLQGAGRVMPAKIFEYLAVKRPIVAIAPPGELTELLANHTGANCFSPNNVSGIATWLERELQSHRSGRRTQPAVWDLQKFDRRIQTGELAAVLERSRDPSAIRRQRCK